MNRRGFLKLFGGAAVAASANPVRFFAPIGGWKSDVIVNPNNGIFGLQYWHVNSCSGSLAGINRAIYPGRLSTPNINLDAPLTAAAIRQIQPKLEAAIYRSLGYDLYV